MRRIASAMVALLALAPVLGPLRSVGGPRDGFHTDSPFVRDGHGRAVFFHGVNAVWKRPPYYPPSAVYPPGVRVPEAQSYFDERDAALMEALGFNSVRLGIIWKGLEPARDLIDSSYLDRIADIVELLGRHHITVLLDFHQDMYNERFQGEGFPDWATHSEALADQPVPGGPTIPAATLTDVPPTNCCGFPGNYFTPAVMRAFDNLWLNNFGLWHEYRDAWRAVAWRFRGADNVIGYDLLNEPWPGSQWESCANPEGCPAFDMQLLQPFFESVITGIRDADPDGIVWWEPNVTNDFGAANNVGLARPIYDPFGNTGISFHDYCLVGGLVPGVSRADDPECPIAEQLTFAQQAEAAGRNGSALLMTEFGASDDLVDIGRVAGWADENMVSWHYWHYGEWSEPTGNPSEQGLFARDLDRSTLKQAKVQVLSRPYPQAVAGTPLSFRFDPATKGFVLRYLADLGIESARHPTEVFVAPSQYPGGFVIHPSGAERLTACPESRLHVVCFRNTGSGMVEIRVSPAT